MKPLLQIKIAKQVVHTAQEVLSMSEPEFNDVNTTDLVGPFLISLSASVQNETFYLNCTVTLRASNARFTQEEKMQHALSCADMIIQFCNQHKSMLSPTSLLDLPKDKNEIANQIIQYTNDNETYRYSHADRVVSKQQPKATSISANP